MTGERRRAKRPTMSQYKSDLLRLLDERGYIHQVTDAGGLDALAAQQVVPGYIGFDATAPVAPCRQPGPDHDAAPAAAGRAQADRADGRRHHARSAIPRARTRAASCSPTTLINANIASIRRVFERFLTFGDGPTDAVMVNNADWLDALEYIPFLRDVGRHFTINRMLTFDSVKLRLEREQPLTFLEFNYMILQAYDFLELSRRAALPAADGRLGPVGQYRQRHRTRPPHRRHRGLRPDDAADHHRGRREDGQDRGGRGLAQRGPCCRPYDYWQFWRNTEDADVGRFLRLFTDLPLDEIARLEALQGAEINDAKKMLADEATAMCAAQRGGGGSRRHRAPDLRGRQSGEALPTLKVAERSAIVDALIGLGLCARKTRHED